MAYTRLSSTKVLHCDAFARVREGNAYLVIDWHEGGLKRVALDHFLIEADGLTPVWALGDPLAGDPRHWHAGNNAMMARIHRTVLALADKALDTGQWSRVSVQAHYVATFDTDTDVVRNMYGKTGQAVLVTKVRKTPYDTQL